MLPADIGLPSQLYLELPLGRALELLERRTRLVQVYSAGRHSLLSAECRHEAEGTDSAARESGE